MIGVEGGSAGSTNAMPERERSRGISVGLEKSVCTGIIKYGTEPSVGVRRWSGAGRVADCCIGVKWLG